MLITLAWIGGLFLVVAVGWPYAAQRKMIFPAPPGPIPQVLEAGVEHVPLDAGHAFLALPTESTTRAPLMVFTHGNAELAHWSLESFRYFRDRGIAVLLVEYPGYGGTPGSPSSDSIGRAVVDALDRVTDRPDIDPGRVVAYGRSIGTGAACLLAAQRQVAALVLESPFVTLKLLAEDLGYPGFLLKDRFDNARVVASLDAPILLYHGTRDEIIPYHHSERLREMSTRASLLSAECGHNDCPRPWREIEAFLVANGIL